MFKKKSFHHIILDQLISGQILSDIDAKQAFTSFRENNTQPKQYIYSDDRYEVALPSLSDIHTNVSTDAITNIIDINDEYSDNALSGYAETSIPYLENDFALFCMLEFNLEHKDDVYHFIKDRKNLEIFLERLNDVYSQIDDCTEINMSSAEDRGFFTETLLSHDMTEEEICILLGAMRTYTDQKICRPSTYA